MKKILLISVLSIFAFACASADKQILGNWVEPIPGMPGKTQGISLQEGGKAASINMATLVYTQWDKQADKLVLTGKSIGNGQEIDFTSEWKIEKLTNDELLLSSDGRTLHYTRE